MTTSETTTADELLSEILSTKPEPEAANAPADDEEIELDKLKQRTPPKDGSCLRCGELKPINRMKLCYKCWVISCLEEKIPGWKPGDAHPAWCDCEGLSGHETGRRPQTN